MTLCFLLYNISRSVYHSCNNLHRHKQKRFRISIFFLYFGSSQGHRFQSVSREVLFISGDLRLCLTQIFNKKHAWVYPRFCLCHIHIFIVRTTCVNERKSYNCSTSSCSTISPILHHD